MEMITDKDRGSIILHFSADECRPESEPAFVTSFFDRVAAQLEVIRQQKLPGNSPRSRGHLLDRIAQLEERQRENMMTILSLNMTLELAKKGR